MKASIALRHGLITPRQHGILDYFQSAFLIVAPTLLGLGGVTAGVVRSFGVAQAVMNSLSDTPVAVRRLIPFPMHGALEKWGGIASLALALFADGRAGRNRDFLAAYTLIG